MRISTGMLYETGITGILNLQSAQSRLQQQIATGRRVLTPSDDPIAAATALEVTQVKGLNEQYKVNIENARAPLLLGEQALGDVTRLLQDVKTLAVNAGNPALRNEDRASLAAELQARYQELLGIANRTDGSGQYLFSGYRGSTQPFTETVPGTVSYNGDEGQRLAQIGASRRLAISDAGSAVFQTVREGNGTFVAAAGTGNTGTGIISTGTVTDPLAWQAAANPRDFSIRFHVDSAVTPPVTTYDIVDNVNNVSLLTGAAPAAGPFLRTYVEGTAIRLQTQAPPDTNPTPFNFGAEVAVTGSPADGDTFSVRAAATQDIFSTLNDLITTLNNGTSAVPASTARYQNGLNTALTNIDNALDHILTVRSSSGVRLLELDRAQNAADDAVLSHSQNLSRLQDLDFAAAISELSQRQGLLEAAQQSFVQITRLRLFDFI